MEPIKMLALDLDGTLAVNGHDVLPATRAALTDLHNDGVEVVIATGRRFRTTRFVMENLGFDVYAVCNGGALIKTPEMETLREAVFSAGQIASLAEIARCHGLSVFAQMRFSFMRETKHIILCFSKEIPDSSHRGLK